MSWNRTPPHPKKHLGQNFLIDNNIIEKIISVAEIGDKDRVLEIGPGKGALSLPLYSRAGLYVGVEKDLELALYLRAIEPEMSIVVMDAQRLSWEKVQRLSINKVLGNLPYNIASLLIWDICAFAKGYDRFVFTLQKEVAERICSRAGDRNYGPLGVWVQVFCETKMEFLVSPNSFRPIPGVTSAVVSLVPRRDVTLSKEEKKKLAFVIKYCFRSPRKQIGNLLKKKWSSDMDEFFQKEGLDRKMRPCELTFVQYKKLMRLF